MAKNDKYKTVTESAEEEVSAPVEAVESLPVPVEVPKKAVSAPVTKRQRPSRNEHGTGSKAVKMAFNAWFANKTVNDARLRGKAHKGDEILTFFGGSGLSDYEYPSTFDTQLAVYFGK